MKRLIILTILILLASASMFYYFNSAPERTVEIEYTIPKGESLSKTAYRLQSLNAVKNRYFFKIIAYAKGKTTIQTGKYRLYPGMTSSAILKKLTTGEVITQAVTIPEGFNLYQIAERLEKQDITAKKLFLHYAFNKKFIRSLGIKGPSAEGYLFPDTYVFPEDSDPRDIIAHMFQKMKNILAELGQKYKNPLRTTHRLLTMASLVEEEAQVENERLYVSSVFHNRLVRGWRMDCDPTVRYAVKKFERPLSRRDLASTNPYNTYTHIGLPPGPISSPGKEAIRAALQPKKTSYLYFVARNDGTHYFSKSLREHNRAVAVYQRGEKIPFVDNQKLGP